MNDTALVKSNAKPAVAATDANLYESLALRGDLSGLKPQEKTAYYAGLCQRLGLDPYTQPFLPLKLNGKEVLYASRGATDQLARVHSVTRRITKREHIADVYVVTCEASLPSGRVEEATGAVAIGSLKGDALANALMKAETKAKRRAVLSILGLGLLDETELETIPAQAKQPVAGYFEENAADTTAEDASETAPTIAPEHKIAIRESLDGRENKELIENITARLKVLDRTEASFNSWYQKEYDSQMNWRQTSLVVKRELLDKVLKMKPRTTESVH